MAHALVGGAAVLTGCGQKGPLFLPTSPDSVVRATLPESLMPWPVKPTPSAPAHASPSTPAVIPAPSPMPALVR